MSTITDRETPDRVRADFRSDAYLRINARRLEHLASLGLPLREKRVLELGAGIGDLTGFFLDRGCEVVSVEGREMNAALYREQHRGEPKARVIVDDLNAPTPLDDRFQIVFSYGLLYHLADPQPCLDWMCQHCSDLLILSTCVTASDQGTTHPADEDASYHSQALDGRACRPTRQWVYNRLSAHMPHVYTTLTQPAHEEFPLDWRNPGANATGLIRAVFIASRAPLDLPTLRTGVHDTHEPS